MNFARLVKWVKALLRFKKSLIDVTGKGFDFYYYVNVQELNDTCESRR